MTEIIVGSHSIAAALRNPERGGLVLYGTNQSVLDFKKQCRIKDEELKRIKVVLKKNHDFQEEAKRRFKEAGFTYSRVTSNLLLQASELPAENITWVYKKLDAKEPVRLLCLDQVTDAHNGAAIMRSAAFFGVDAIIISIKGNFGQSPTFYRIASGAPEYVKVINCASLPRIVSKLAEMGVVMIGLSEHADEPLEGNLREQACCLVLGAEDVGISNALARVVEKKMALTTQGPIKSLNVSVAAAVAMEKLFGAN